MLYSQIILCFSFIKRLVIPNILCTFATNHRHKPQRRCWCDIVGKTKQAFAVNSITFGKLGGGKNEIME